ncbi:hypothetical protein LUZ60_016337 [Juncus effusus]|nr:hypothetical protein LUZ60_016337 [Juncus effusus]
MTQSVDPSTREKVSEVFKEAASVGLAVCRTWGFYDGESGLQKSPSVYDEHVFKTVLTRVNTLNNITYKDDPTIFAWELMRCTSDPSGSNLQDWIQEMAFHVKSIDPFHLLEIGSEGFYGPSTPDRLPINPGRYYGQVGADFMKNHQSLEIDFASVHIYPDSW